MQPTKTSQALARYRNGDFKGAFRIFATFHIGFTEQERKCLKIAQECLAGHSELYKMLGRDVEATIAEAKLIINKKYRV